MLALGVGTAIFIRENVAEPQTDFAEVSHQSLTDARAQTPGAFADIGGQIHLSLAEPGGPVRPFVLDAASGELRPTWPDVPGAHYTPARSPIEPSLTVVSGYPDGDAGPHGWTFQLFLVATETEDVIRQLTFDENAGKRMPQWSPDGTRIAYHALSVPSDEVEGINILDLNNWGVFVLDVATGATERIAAGAMPLWSRNGTEILFAAGRGLAVFDLRQGETEQVLESIAITYERKLGISPAGDVVAWTDPYGAIELYRVGADGFASLEPMEPVRTGLVDTYWPTFSPDGRYLAVQGIDRDYAGAAAARVVIVDLDTGAVAKVADISGFEFLRSYLSDWTES